jgi:hypothetical protein
MGGHRLRCAVLLRVPPEVRRRYQCRGPSLEALEEGRTHLTLTLDMRGLLVPVVALFYKGLTNRYMTVEAQGLKRAAESA